MSVWTGCSPRSLDRGVEARSAIRRAAWGPPVVAAVVLSCVALALLLHGTLSAPVVPAASSHPSARTGLSRLSFGVPHPVPAVLAPDAAAYRISGLVARNPAQRFSARFGRSGVAITAGSTRFTLSLKAFGRISSLQPVALVAPVASANRVSYAHGSLHEWWANGPLGLEQGFDIAKPPAGSGALTLSLAIPAGARLEHGALRLPGGLSYSGLRATDARGRPLRAWLQRRGGRVLVRVDDVGALYPLRIDPVILTPVTQSPASNADTAFGPVSLAFSPSGGLLATANGRQNGPYSANDVSVFTVNDSSGALTPVTQMPASNADTGTAPYSVAFSPGGGLLATANYDSNTVSVFTVNDTTGALTPVTQSPVSNADTGTAPYSVAFSPAGELLASANTSGTVSLFTLNDTTGTLTPDPQTPASNADTGTAPYSVAFSPNGGLLATANSGCGSCVGGDTVSVFTLTESAATGTGPGTGSTGGTETVASTAAVGSVAGGSGVITASLSCPAGGAGCGAVSLQATVTEHLKHKKIRAVTARAKKKPKTTKQVVIATAGTTLTAGESTTVTLTLNQTGKALLKRFHKFKTIVTVSSSTGTTIDTITITLRQPKKEHKHKKK